MAEEPREFEPLMISIANLLSAIQNQPLANVMTAVTALQGQYDSYALCCCRRAHVVPDSEAQD